MATYQKIDITAPYSIFAMEYFSSKYKGIVTVSLFEGNLFINGMIPDDLRSQILSEIESRFDSVKIWEVITEVDDVTFESSSGYMTADSTPFA